MRLHPTLAGVSETGARLYEVNDIPEGWLRRDSKRAAQILQDINKFESEAARRASQLELLGWAVDLRPELLGVIAIRRSGKPMSGHRVRIQICRYIQLNEPKDINLVTGEILSFENLFAYPYNPWRIKCRKAHNGDERIESLDAAFKRFDELVTTESRVG